MQILSPFSSARRIGRANDALTRRPARRGVRRAALEVIVVTTALLLAAAAAVPAASASHPLQAAPDGTVAARVDRFLTTQLQESAIPGAAVAVTRGPSRTPAPLHPLPRRCTTVSASTTEQESPVDQSSPGTTRGGGVAR